MKSKITKSAQKAAACILTEFAFVESMRDFWDKWNVVFLEYDLCDDPFTRLPVTRDEYAKLRIEYERQALDEKFDN